VQQRDLRDPDWDGVLLVPTGLSSRQRGKNRALHRRPCAYRNCKYCTQHWRARQPVSTAYGVIGVIILRTQHWLARQPVSTPKNNNTPQCTLLASLDLESEMTYSGKNLSWRTTRIPPNVVTNCGSKRRFDDSKCNGGGNTTIRLYQTCSEYIIIVPDI
jgi:hypothetical protein